MSQTDKAQNEQMFSGVPPKADLRARVHASLVTPEQEAGDEAVVEALQPVFARHTPDDFMLTLGILFAQGLAKCSEEHRDDALEEFIYRLRKYTGIELKPGKAAE